MTDPRLQLDQELPSALVVGQGQYQLIRGEIRGVSSPELALEVSTGGAGECSIELFPGESDADHEFLVTILWRPEDVGTHPALTLLLGDDSGGSSRHLLGELELLERAALEERDASRMGDDPLVAICMATFNPDMARLTRQVESILCQSYRNWLLIVSDDASDEHPGNDELEALCQLDPRRIRLYRHQQNLGFYRNFERALTYLPDNVQLVAFADQDDIWYPEKLQVLVDLLKDSPDATLAYSDMRIVGEDGSVIADSYWQNRRNEYRDLATVLVANTVTGAASLFRRELVDKALPFPPQPGEAYHDHWLACVALSLGNLRYFPEPLYDYMQYHDSVLGHQDDAAPSLAGKLTGKLRNRSRTSWQSVYRRDCLRLQLMARTLAARIPGRQGSAALRLMGGDWLSSLRLLWAFVLNRLSGRSSQAAELWLAMGFIRGQGRKADCQRIS